MMCRLNAHMLSKTTFGTMTSVRPSPEMATRAFRVIPSRQPKSTENLVVIGHGMVSHRFIQKLVARGGHRRYRVVVYGDEPRLAYDRVNLSNWFKQRDDHALTLVDRDWYAEHGIEIRVGDRIESIRLDLKMVRTGSGFETRYDHLVLATGSSAYVPPIPGTDLPGVFVYRTIDDVQNIAEYAKHSRSVAVIGGGLLGLEAARAMRDLGLETHVIELGGWLMNQQLDEASARVLETQIQAMGVRVLKNKRSEEITRQASGLNLRFNQGSSLTVDMVVISAGIRANDALARKAGIDCDISVGGVLVNDHLQSTEPDVYAIGECASHRGRTYGLVAPGYQMAETLADNLMRRRKKPFADADLSTRLKLLGVQVSVFGRHREGDDRLTWENGDARRTIAVQYGRLIGATAVGDWHQLDEVRRAVDENRRVRPGDLEHFATHGELWPDQQEAPVRLWPDNRTVCQCASVTCGTLKSAIQAGCRTVESLAAETRATTVCGSCRPLVAQLADIDEKVAAVPGWRPLLIASIGATIGLALLMAIPDLTVNSSVASAWHVTETLWRNTFWKQVSGFTLLGLCGIVLLLSVRKRLKKFSFGHFGSWRVFHATVGGLTLAALLVHTGGRMGSNLNFMLMTVFLMLNALGAVAGIIVAMEGRSKGMIAFRSRQLRPWLVWAHLILFWPLPVLIAAHVASVYYF